jgi:hypothetical protein
MKIGLTAPTVGWTGSSVCETRWRTCWSSGTEHCFQPLCILQIELAFEDRSDYGMLIGDPDSAPQEGQRGEAGGQLRPTLERGGRWAHPVASGDWIRIWLSRPRLCLPGKGRGLLRWDRAALRSRFSAEQPVPIDWAPGRSRPDGSAQPRFPAGADARPDRRPRLLRRRRTERDHGRALWSLDHPTPARHRPARRKSAAPRSGERPCGTTPLRARPPRLRRRLRGRLL